jgi:cellulose biosynthesis protein BcsQ
MEQVIEQHIKKIRAFIVAVISQKGGVGKTMVDAQLAIALAIRGLKVAIIDMDEDQYSAAKMMTRRNQANILPVVSHFIATPETLKQIITKISQEFHVIFLESTGKITEELRLAVSLADLIISPLEAVQDNIDTIPNLDSTLDKLINQGVLANHVRAFIVPNKVPSQQREINFNNTDNKLVRMLNLEPSLKHFKFTKTFIKHRPSIYPECYALGKGVSELKGAEINPKDPREGLQAITKSVQEINNLLEELFYAE